MTRVMPPTPRELLARAAARRHLALVRAAVIALFAAASSVLALLGLGALSVRFALAAAVAIALVGGIPFARGLVERRRGIDDLIREGVDDDTPGLARRRARLTSEHERHVRANVLRKIAHASVASPFERALTPVPPVPAELAGELEELADEIDEHAVDARAVLAAQDLYTEVDAPLYASLPEAHRAIARAIRLAHDEVRRAA